MLSYIAISKNKHTSTPFLSIFASQLFVGYPAYFHCSNLPRSQTARFPSRRPPGMSDFFIEIDGIKGDTTFWHQTIVPQKRIRNTRNGSWTSWWFQPIDDWESSGWKWKYLKQPPSFWIYQKIIQILTQSKVTKVYSTQLVCVSKNFS